MNKRQRKKNSRKKLIYLAKIYTAMAIEMACEAEYEQRHEHYPNCDKGGVLPPLKKGELIFV